MRWHFEKEIFEWVVAIAVAVVCVLLIQKFLFVTYTVSGDSMYPTLKIVKSNRQQNWI